jgi:hypothetical protein
LFELSYKTIAIVQLSMYTQFRNLAPATAVSHGKSTVFGSEAITDLGARATTLLLKLEASVGAALVGSSAKRM